MKVILRDSLDSRTPEQEEIIKKILKNNSDILQRTTKTDVLVGADVILIHDEITSLKNAEISEIKKHSWVINYHLDLPNKPLREKEGSLSLELVLENLGNFLNHIKNKEELTKEDFNILYDFDPKLEASIYLWKSLTLLGVKVQKGLIEEADYKKEAEKLLKNDDDQPIYTEKWPLFRDWKNYGTDMEELYKQLFSQN